MMGTIVRVLAPWSQMQNRLGRVAKEEGNEVVVSFGDPLFYFRYIKQEVDIVMEQGKIVGERPYEEITIKESLWLQQMGISCEGDGDRRVVVLRRELVAA